MNNSTLLTRCLFFALTLFFPFHLFAQTSAPDTTNLRIGVAGNAPFITQMEDNESGISFEIWEAIAENANWKFETQPFSSVSEAILALENDDIDVVVGPTSITAERAENISFSQPYFQASLSILSRADSLNIWERIRPFFSMKLLYSITIFLFILSCVGTLLWLAERKRSPDQFPMEPARGIANGMWCAIVTMTTTGYGDLAPITFSGRVIAGAWMIISIIFATTMVAGIASTLTLTGMDSFVITKVEQLNKNKVAVLADSPASHLVEQFHGQVVPIETLEEGYDLLLNKEVQAIVFDRPQVLFYMKNNPNPSITISEAQYTQQAYGFAFPLNSKLTHTLNVHLLQLRETGQVKRIISQWLGAER